MIFDGQNAVGTNTDGALCFSYYKDNLYFVRENLRGVRRKIQKAIILNNPIVR